MKVNELYRWGYQQDRSISFLTNVIQCQCGNKAKKMRGLFNLVRDGKEVRPAQFDLFKISLDGCIRDISILETFA